MDYFSAKCVNYVRVYKAIIPIFNISKNLMRGVIKKKIVCYECCLSKRKQ